MIHDTIYDIIKILSKAAKTLQKMRNNPNGWKISELETVANQLGLIVRQGKGSHTVLMTKSESLSVPAKRPIKPIYIKQFLKLIEGK